MDPRGVKPGYNPEIDNDYLVGAGNLTEDNLLVLVTVRVPADLKKMSVNLQAHIIINVDERKACQVIVNDKFPVKYYIYDILQERKEGVSHASTI